MKSLILCLLLASPTVAKTDRAAYDTTALVALINDSPFHGTTAPLMIAALRVSEGPRFSDKTDNTSRHLTRLISDSATNKMMVPRSPSIWAATCPPCAFSTPSPTGSI
jgi:hypothetical protein